MHALFPTFQKEIFRLSASNPSHFSELAQFELERLGLDSTFGGFDVRIPPLFALSKAT